MKEVISVDVMRRSDAYTIKTETSSLTLMYRAGEAIFKSVKWHGKIAIVCGKGNNGGDGLVLASLLHKDFEVCVYLFCEDVSIDSGHYLSKCYKEGIKVLLIDENTSFDGFDIIVDAIFGTGFNKSVEGIYKDIINKINDSIAYVVSIDINSGLNGDNGLCNLAVVSDLTISIGSYKTGHFLNKAKDYIKNLINVDIGIKLVDHQYELIEESDLKSVLKPRLNFSNKSTYGYIALIGGSKNYAGAVRLAQAGACAMRAGAGVCKVCTIKSLVDVVLHNSLETTVYPISEHSCEYVFNEGEINELISNVKSIAVGMGLGNSEEVKKLITYLIKNYQGILIIDADGLNALSELNKNILKDTKAKIVLTPHLKELERLTGIKIKDILNDSIEIAKRFAQKYQVTLLVKGPTTIVTDGVKAYLVNKGCAGMATAGSGDVLSGIICAVCGYNVGNILMAVSCAAYINGLAGEYARNEYGDISMIASDTVKYIPKVIKEIKE